MTMCEEWQDWIPVLVLDAVTQADRMCIEEHLRRCPECRHLAESYAPVVELLAYAAKPVEPNPELKWQVLSAIFAERE